MVFGATTCLAFRNLSGDFSRNSSTIVQSSSSLSTFFFSLLLNTNPTNRYFCALICQLVVFTELVLESRKVGQFFSNNDHHKFIDLQKATCWLCSSNNRQHLNSIHTKQAFPVLSIERRLSI